MCHLDMTERMVAIFGQIYISIITFFRRDLGNLLSNAYSPFALANFAQLCSRYVKAFL